MGAGKLCAALLLFALPAFGAWNPDGWEVAPGSRNTGFIGTGAVVLDGLLGFYRAEIGPALSGGCPSYPSCSAYSLMAIERHGPVKGAILTASRLVSESDEALFAPMISFGGVKKVWYPVEEHFFLTDGHDGH